MTIVNCIVDAANIIKDSQVLGNHCHVIKGFHCTKSRTDN